MLRADRPEILLCVTQRPFCLIITRLAARYLCGTASILFPRTIAILCRIFCGSSRGCCIPLGALPTASSAKASPAGRLKIEEQKIDCRRSVVLRMVDTGNMLSDFPPRGRPQPVPLRSCYEGELNAVFAALILWTRSTPAETPNG